MKKEKTMHGIQGLVPELLQRMASFIAFSWDMVAFLEAFPPTMLLEPWDALLKLFIATRDERLLSTQDDIGICLWPYFQLPKEINDPDIVESIKKAVVLIPVVHVEAIDAPWMHHLPPNTKLSFKAILNVANLNLAMEKWHDRIQSLHISSTHWEDAHLHRLCQAIETLPNLKKLSLFWGVDDNAPYQEEIINALAKSSVTSLQLHYYYPEVEWDIETTKVFASWIIEKRVESIQIHDIVLHNACAKVLLQALFTSQTLTHFNICKSLLSQLLQTPQVLPPALKSLQIDSITNDGYNYMVKLLQHSKVESLYFLGECDEGSGPTVTEFWTSTLPSMHLLRILDIERHSMDQVICHGIASVLPQLVELHLDCTGLNDDGVEIIAKAMPECKRLEKLSLINMDLSYASALSLSHAIPHCPTLKSLDLAGNTIGSIGAYLLSSVLKYLNEVDLSRNNIGNDGAIAISRVIHEFPHMHILNLSENHFKSQGVVKIIQALCASSHRAGYIDLSETLESEGPTACQSALDKLPHKYWCLI